MTLSDLVKRTPVDKGWSGDKKYCAETADGTKYLLRTSEPGTYEKKKAEFDAMCEVDRLGLPMCRPLAFGQTDGFVYSIQTWIDGEDAEEVMTSFSDTEQYVYGLEAGRMLKKIHSILAPEMQEDWESRFNRKIDRKIRGYHDCPLKFDGADNMIRYIEENRHLLHGRPQSFQHGDYHIGNMMIDQSGTLTVIDFNRFDYGDPWEEFNRIVWCAQCSPLFASGMVNGYFDGDVPMEFWRLLALYISSNTLSSVYWAIPFGQDEIDTMMNQAREVLEWYDNMNNPVPSWYFRGGVSMPEVKFFEEIDDSLLKFAVISARYGDKWLFCRHKLRETWEIPGGHREPGEAIDDTARRELYEETGAAEFHLRQITMYGVCTDDGITYGMLYFADVRTLGELPPEMEIGEIIQTDGLPENLTYPLIQPALHKKTTEFLKK